MVIYIFIFIPQARDRKLMVEDTRRAVTVSVLAASKITVNVLK